MAYNRWLSSQYSYSPGYDLMHYGRKGMRWGKHIFGLPEITLNGGGGGAVDLEELQKMLEQGKITLDEFKAKAEKHFQSVVDVNKDGLKQVQNKFADYMKKISETYENFKVGNDGRYPELAKNDWYVTDPASGDKITNEVYERRHRRDMDAEWKKWTEAERIEAETSRVNSKIQDRKGQESRDRRENLERKRAERSAAPRTVSKSSNQNGSSKTASKDNYSLEDVVKLAFGAASTSGSTSTGSTRTPNQNKEPKKETYDVTAKQKKIYQTIGKFLNYALTVTNPYHSLRKGLTKQR